MSKTIKEKQFTKKANVKHVKTRTPYKFVNQYEKGFKRAFAGMVGEMADEYVNRTAEMLNVKPTRIQKAKQAIQDVFKPKTDTGVKGDS